MAEATVSWRDEEPEPVVKAQAVCQQHSEEETKESGLDSEARGNRSISDPQPESLVFVMTPRFCWSPKFFLEFNSCDQNIMSSFLSG